MPAVPGRKDATGRAAQDHRPGAVRRFHPFPICRHRLSPAVSRGRSVRLSGTVFGSRAGFLGPLFRPSDRVQDREIKFAWLAFRRRSRGCRSFSSASLSSPRRRLAFPPGFSLARPPRPRLASARLRCWLPAFPSASSPPRFRSASGLVSGFPSASPLPCVSARLRCWLPAFPSASPLPCVSARLRLVRTASSALPPEVPVYHPVTASCSARLLFVWFMVRISKFALFVSGWSCSFRFIRFVSGWLSSLRLFVPVRLVLFVSGWLSLFPCVHARSQALFIYYFLRILYTSNGEKQMYFLSKVMCFLRIMSFCLNIPDYLSDSRSNFHRFRTL